MLCLILSMIFRLLVNHVKEHCYRKKIHNPPKKTRLFQCYLVIYMGVSLNGGTPISHPKWWSFFSRKPHGCWVPPTILGVAPIYESFGPQITHPPHQPSASFRPMAPFQPNGHHRGGHREADAKGCNLQRFAWHDVLVGGWTNPGEQNMLVKMGSSSPRFGVKIKKIFETTTYIA